MRYTSLMMIFMLALGASAQDGTSTGTDGSPTILPAPTTSTTLSAVTSVTTTSVPTASTTSVPTVSTTSVPTVSSASTTPSTTAPSSSATTTAPTTSLVTSFSRTPFSTVAASTTIAPPLPSNAAFRLALSCKCMALGCIAGLAAFLL